MSLFGLATYLLMLPKHNTPLLKLRPTTPKLKSLMTFRSNEKLACVLVQKFGVCLVFNMEAY